jgi:predicted CoA-binding protein
MNRIDELAREFLDQKRFAVAGVSATREDAANLIYRTLCERGYTVWGINPRIRTFRGEPCYPNVASLPAVPDVLVAVTRPPVTEDLVRQCIEAGVPRVWMHCMLGTHPRLLKKMADTIGSVSPEAVRLCRENGIAVIPGSCPMQFLAADFGHTCMRGMLRATGALAVPASLG